MNKDNHHGGFSNHDFSLLREGIIALSSRGGTGILEYSISVAHDTSCCKYTLLVITSTVHAILDPFTGGPFTAKGSDGFMQGTVVTVEFVEFSANVFIVVVEMNGGTVVDVLLVELKTTDCKVDVVIGVTVDVMLIVSVSLIGGVIVEVKLSVVLLINVPSVEVNNGGTFVVTVISEELVSLEGVVVFR